MELITIQENGQITLPTETFHKLKRKNIEKTDFVGREKEEVVSPTRLAILKAQAAFEGFAEEMGLETEEDVFAFCRQIRREMREESHANNG
ncbi:MAG: hypothetical protein FWG65_07870 [Turicibacter sp.]|nr:hypothetical protein [Turicibacter sp.]